MLRIELAEVSIHEFLLYTLQSMATGQSDFLVSVRHNSLTVALL